jgi:hypothetical protein
MPQGNLFVLPMNLSGCGEVTDWIIVGRGRGGSGTRNRTIDLYLLHPSKSQPEVYTIITSTETRILASNTRGTHTLTSVGFTFSSGDFLGFYHYSTYARFLVARTTISGRSILSSTSGSPPSTNVVTLANTDSRVPLMSISSELLHKANTMCFTGVSIICVIFVSFHIFDTYSQLYALSTKYQYGVIKYNGFPDNLLDNSSIESHPII